MQCKVELEIEQKGANTLDMSHLEGTQFSKEIC